MSNQNGVAEKTCQGCRHWHRRPADPGSVGDEASGECRCNPPSATIIPTNRGNLVLAAYPILPASFAACGQHSPPGAD